MKRIVLSSLLAVVVCCAFARTNVNYVGTTYLTDEIVGGWVLSEGNPPSYICAIAGNTYKIHKGAKAAEYMKKAGRIHVLKINAEPGATIEVFAKEKFSGANYVISVGNELFYFDEDTNMIYLCSGSFVMDSKQLKVAGKDGGFVITEDNYLMIYD